MCNRLMILRVKLIEQVCSYPGRRGVPEQQRGKRAPLYRCSMRGPFPHRPDFLIYFRCRVLASDSLQGACVFLLIPQIARMAKDWRAPHAFYSPGKQAGFMTHLRQTMAPDYRHLLLLRLDKADWQGPHNAERITERRYSVCLGTYLLSNRRIPKESVAAVGMDTTGLLL